MEFSENDQQTLTIKKLKKSKKYQVRIRAYKKIEGTTYYGAWSTVRISGKIDLKCQRKRGCCTKVLKEHFMQQLLLLLPANMQIYKFTVSTGNRIQISKSFSDLYSRNLEQNRFLRD